MTEREGGRRSIVLSLAGFFVLFLVQLVAYFYTNIMVLLAEALMALGEMLISAFLLLSLYWAKKPADESYMFGRGRAQNVAALVSSVVIISFMSLETFREAVPKLVSAEASEFQNTTLALAVIGLAMVVSLIPFIDILRSKSKAASLKAQKVGLIIELASGVASLAGIALMSRGYPWADPLASTLVGLVMLYSGLNLLRENAEFLVGKAPGKDFTDRVVATAMSVKGVLGLHDLMAEYVGPDTVHTGFHIQVAAGTPIEEASRIAHEVSDKVGKETGCSHCVIHIDAAEGDAKQNIRR